MKKVLRLIEWPITEDAFPDPVFRAYVFDNFDVDKDGKISEEEALNVKTIDVSDRGIKSLTGLEYFPKLRELYCGDNQLTSLDVTKNPELSYLCCEDNQLTSLDVTNNPELSYLYCEDNELTSLDVTKNPKLSALHCYFNQLISLDVSNNPELSALHCSSNQLTSLDVTNNPKLNVLSCDSNQLTSLDVTKNPKLEWLYCEDNQLTSLDVSKTGLGNSTNAYPLDCSSMSSLQTLTLKRGWRIEGINVKRSTDHIPSQTTIQYVD